MDREQLNRANAETIARWYRDLSDAGGRAPQRLLDDLARTAEQHADDVLHEEVGVSGSAPKPDTPEPAEPLAKTAPRRRAAGKS